MAATRALLARAHGRLALTVRAAALVAAALVMVVATGCGSGADTTAKHGKALFASQCAQCHTLAGRESGAPGGDLAVPKLHVADIASFARVMPTRRRLSRAEALAVATYVADVERQRH